MQPYQRQREMWRDHESGRTPVMAATLNYWEDFNTQVSDTVLAHVTELADHKDAIAQATELANSAYAAAAAAVVIAGNNTSGGTTTTPTETTTVVKAMTFDTADGINNNNTAVPVNVNGGNLNITNGSEVWWWVDPVEAGAHYRVTVTPAAQPTGLLEVSLSMWSDSSGAWIEPATTVTGTSGAANVVVDVTVPATANKMTVQLKGTDTATSWSIADVTAVKVTPAPATQPTTTTTTGSPTITTSTLDAIWSS